MINSLLQEPRVLTLLAPAIVAVFVLGFALWVDRRR